MKWEQNSIWKWNHTFWRDPWKRCFLKSKLKSNYRTKDKLENSYFKDYACLFQYFTHKNSWYKARKLLWLVLYNKKHTSICRMCQNFTDICIILQRNDSGKWKRKILHYIMGFANSAVSWFSVVHFQDCFFGRKISFHHSGSGLSGFSWSSLAPLAWLEISSASSAFLKSMILIEVILTLGLIIFSLQVNDVIVQLLVKHPVHEQHSAHTQQHAGVPWRPPAAGEAKPNHHL